ncbi:hypothetical protein F0365_07750 [Nonlabens sp. Ci31]|nr:hypothetical protein F0365_07750 [Nonlabens sp. Ci31]
MGSTNDIQERIKKHLFGKKALPLKLQTGN